MGSYSVYQNHLSSTGSSSRNLYFHHPLGSIKLLIRAEGELYGAPPANAGVD